MPIVQIHLLEGRNVEQKRQLVAKMTDVICDTVNVTPDKVKIIISEMHPEHYASAGVLVADTKK